MPRLADLIPPKPAALFFGAAAHAELASYRPSARECEAIQAMKSDARREGYLLGRLAAHRAVTAAGGSAATPIGTGIRGEPLFPEGYVGSLSHTADEAVAVVAPATAARALGVDLQERRPLRERFAERIAWPEEVLWAAAQPDPLIATIMLFSAREAIFKALNPLLGEGPRFLDVKLIWEPAASRFRVEYVEGFSPRERLAQVEMRSSALGVLSWTNIPPPSS